jgi:hypothetical protein
MQDNAEIRKFHVPFIKRAAEVVIFMFLQECLKFLSKSLSLSR